MRSARTWPWAKTRRWVGQFSGPEPLSPFLFCLDSTTITSGYDFRKGQVRMMVPIGVEQNFERHSQITRLCVPKTRFWALEPHRCSSRCLHTHRMRQLFPQRGIRSTTSGSRFGAIANSFRQFRARLAARVRRDSFQGRQEGRTLSHNPSPNSDCGRASAKAACRSRNRCPT
jgi:hypothetical protein